jgi:hypothetical protein
MEGLAAAGVALSSLTCPTGADIHFRLLLVGATFSFEPTDTRPSITSYYLHDDWSAVQNGNA